MKGKNLWADAARLAVIGTLVVNSGCSEPEGRIPDSIKAKVKELQIDSAANPPANRTTGSTAMSEAFSRFTVRPYDDWTMSEASAMALARIGAPAVPALTDALRHPQAATRIQAADTLARIGPDASGAVPALVAALDDPDLRVRKSAARALGQIGPAAAEAVPTLIRSIVQPAPESAEPSR